MRKCVTQVWYEQHSSDDTVLRDEIYSPLFNHIINLIEVHSKFNKIYHLFWKQDFFTLTYLLTMIFEIDAILHALNNNNNSLFSQKLQIGAHVTHKEIIYKHGIQM